MANDQAVSATFDHSTLDQSNFQDSLQQHRERLRRLVEIRLDPRVRGRVDASDVIQETQLEACERADEYLSKQEVPFFVWLRFLALQKLSQAHRRHLGTKARDAGREVSIHAPLVSTATSAALAAQLVGPVDHRQPGGRSGRGP